LLLPVVLTLAVVGAMLLGSRQAAAVTAGDVSIDWVAAGAKTYDHTNGNALSSHLGDYATRTISNTNGVVEPLEGGDFKCTHVVVKFDNAIKVGGGTSGPAAVTVNIQDSFNSQATNGKKVGFGQFVDVSVQGTDTGYVGNHNEVVTETHSGGTPPAPLLVNLA